MELRKVKCQRRDGENKMKWKHLSSTSIKRLCLIRVEWSRKDLQRPQNNQFTVTKSSHSFFYWDFSTTWETSQLCFKCVSCYCLADCLFSNCPPSFLIIAMLSAKKQIAFPKLLCQGVANDMEGKAARWKFQGSYFNISWIKSEVGPVAPPYPFLILSVWSES